VDMQDIYAEYRKVTRGLQASAKSEREKVQREAAQQRGKIHEQRGALEVELQSALGSIRTAERLEQRKRDLPITKPRDLGTERKLTETRQQGARLKTELQGLLTELSTAEASAISGIEEQLKDKQAEVDKWRSDTEAEYIEYERELEQYERELEQAELSTDRVARDATAAAREAGIGRLAAIGPGKHEVAPPEPSAEYLERIARDRKAAQDKLNKFVVTIKLPPGASAGARAAAMGKIAGYDLPGAIDAGIGTVTLKLAGFTQANIDAAKEFIDKNIKLDTGKWVSKTEYNKYKASTAEPPKFLYLKTTAPAWFKQAWEYMTEWQEETGETFTDYMQRPGTMIGDIRYMTSPKDSAFRKWYESRESYQAGFVEHPSAESQAELKTRYEAWLALPWYTRIFLTEQPATIDPKTGYYRKLLIGYAPMITPAKLPTRMPKFAPTKTYSITRGEYERLMAYATKDMPAAKRSWLMNPAKLYTKVKGTVTHMPVPQVTQPVILPRVQPIFTQAMPQYAREYYGAGTTAAAYSRWNIATQSWEPMVGSKYISPAEWAKMWNVPTAGVAATGTTRIVPLVIAVPSLVGLTTVGIVAYKVYTPGVSKPVIMPATYTEVKLSTALQSKVSQLSKTMTRAKALEQLGIEEFASALQKPWVTPFEAVKLAQQLIKASPMPMPRPTPSPKPVPTPKPTPSPKTTPTVTQPKPIIPPTIPVTPPPPPPPPSPPPSPPPPKVLPSGGISQLTEKQREGIIAWKQGFMYKLIYPPYGEKDIINTRTPIEGVIYAEGVGSAARSAIARGGRIPLLIRRDMGIMDIAIHTPQGRKPILKFKGDPKQKTKVTPRTKRRGTVKPSIGTAR